jgi:hypothetical protein
VSPTTITTTIKQQLNFTYDSCQKVHTTFILHPSPWLHNCGWRRSISMQMSKSSSGLDCSFTSYRAVPDDAPVFEYCRNGNVRAFQALFLTISLHLQVLPRVSLSSSWCLGPTFGLVLIAPKSPNSNSRRPGNLVTRIATASSIFGFTSSSSKTGMTKLTIEYLANDGCGLFFGRSGSVFLLKSWNTGRTKRPHFVHPICPEDEVVPTIKDFTSFGIDLLAST